MLQTMFVCTGCVYMQWGEFISACLESVVCWSSPQIKLFKIRHQVQFSLSQLWSHVASRVALVSSWWGIAKGGSLTSESVMSSIAVQFFYVFHLKIFYYLQAKYVMITLQCHLQVFFQTYSHFVLKEIRFMAPGKWLTSCNGIWSKLIFLTSCFL